MFTDVQEELPPFVQLDNRSFRPSGFVTDVPVLRGRSERGIMPARRALIHFSAGCDGGVSGFCGANFTAAEFMQ